MFFTLGRIKWWARRSREGSLVLHVFQSIANEPNYYSSKSYVRSFSLFWDEVLTAACLNINKVYWLPLLSVAWNCEDLSAYCVFLFLSTRLSAEMVLILFLEMVCFIIEKITALHSIKHLFWHHCWLLFSLLDLKKSMLIERTRALSYIW